MDLPEVFGRRAATMDSKGPTYDLRITSEVFEDAGGCYIHLVGEDRWWNWLDIPTAERPDRPARAVSGRPGTSGWSLESHDGARIGAPKAPG